LIYAAFKGRLRFFCGFPTQKPHAFKPLYNWIFNKKNDFFAVFFCKFFFYKKKKKSSQSKSILQQKTAETAKLIKNPVFTQVRRLRFLLRFFCGFAVFEVANCV